MNNCVFLAFLPLLHALHEILFLTFFHLKCGALRAPLNLFSFSIFVLLGFPVCGNLKVKFGGKFVE